MILLYIILFCIMWGIYTIANAGDGDEYILYGLINRQNLSFVIDTIGIIELC